MNTILDIYDREVKEGDIIYRPLFSNLNKHKVVKIRKSTVVLSCYRKLIISKYHNIPFTRIKSNNYINQHNSTVVVNKFSLNGNIILDEVSELTPELIQQFQRQPHIRYKY